MFSEEKIKQVFNAIKENGLNAFDDESLAKLLSILNRRELDYFEYNSFKELGNQTRITSIRPLVEMYIEADLLRIKNSDIYPLYIEALKKNRYQEFFTSLKVEELGDIKKYLINTSNKKNEKATKKVINMITQEIYEREANKKPCFE